MAKKDLLKEAIADADMLKKVAIENAKRTLNETFEPKIKALLAKKLNEEAEEAEEEDIDEAKDITADDEDADDIDEAKDEIPADEDGEDVDESIDIDAILAEMEGSDDEAATDDIDEAKDEDADDDADAEDGGENVDEEIDLNQLLGELSEKKEKAPVEDEDETEEEAPADEVDEAAGDKNITDILKNLAKQVNDALKQVAQGMQQSDAGSSGIPMKQQEETTELREAKKYAKLTAKISETNLLNAKLLYLNKVLKESNLDSKQKVKAINAFDKATTVKETKLVYAALSEAFKVKAKKNTLKESLGSIASKAVGTSTKTTKKEAGILDEATYDRWQKLSGLLD
jgi:hypothetical protein